MLLVILMGVLVYFSLFINTGYDFNLLPLHSSRKALGLGGWLVAGGAQGQLLAWIFCNLLVFRKYFKKKDALSVHGVQANSLKEVP